MCTSALLWMALGSGITNRGILTIFPKNFIVVRVSQDQTSSRVQHQTPLVKSNPLGQF